MTIDAGGGSQTIESISRQHYDLGGELAWSLRFPGPQSIYTQPSSTATAGTVPSPLGYGYATIYGYDAMGRENRVDADVGLSGYPSHGSPPSVTTPQISRTVYDTLGRPISTWTGTNDTPSSGTWSPTNNAGSSNMVQVTANVYDGGFTGDGNLTQVSKFPGVGQPDRVRLNLYDWRDRLIATKQGALMSGSMNNTSGETSGVNITHRPLSCFIMNNLDEVTAAYTYDGDGLSLAPFTSWPASALKALATNVYDEQGRVIQSFQHDIDQSTGTDNGTLGTNTFYNHRGEVIAVYSPNGLATKSVYDGAGRPIEQFTTDGGATHNTAGSNLPLLDYTDASGVTNDAVLEQTVTEYDKDSNPTLVISFQRHHDNISYGALGYSLDSSGYTTSRISFVSNIYDEADRMITSINWGNMGDDGATIYNGSAHTFSIPTPQLRDSTAYSGWNQWFRTDYQYDVAGRQAIVADPGGIETRTFYDALGRKVGLTEAYTGTLANNNPSTPARIERAERRYQSRYDRQTQYSYNGADEVTSQVSI